MSEHDPRSTRRREPLDRSGKVIPMPADSERAIHPEELRRLIVERLTLVTSTA
jgi:hypothetical protein